LLQGDHSFDKVVIRAVLFCQPLWLFDLVDEEFCFRYLPFLQLAERRPHIAKSKMRKKEDQAGGIQIPGGRKPVSDVKHHADQKKKKDQGNSDPGCKHDLEKMIWLKRSSFFRFFQNIAAI